MCAITETEMVRWLGQLGGESEILFLTEKLNVGAFRGGMCGESLNEEVHPVPPPPLSAQILVKV